MRALTVAVLSCRWPRVQSLTRSVCPWLVTSSSRPSRSSLPFRAGADADFLHLCHDSPARGTRAAASGPPCRERRALGQASRRTSRHVLWARGEEPGASGVPRGAPWASARGPDGRRASRVAIDPHSVSAARTTETPDLATGWCDRSRLRHRPTRASSRRNSSSRPLARLAGVGRGDPAPPCPGQTGRPWRPRPSYPPPSHRPAAERWFDGRALGPRGRLRPRAASP